MNKISCSFFEGKLIVYLTQDNSIDSIEKLFKQAFNKELFKVSSLHSISYCEIDVTNRTIKKCTFKYTDKQTGEEFIGEEDKLTSYGSVITSSFLSDFNKIKILSNPNIYQHIGFFNNQGFIGIDIREFVINIAEILIKGYVIFHKCKCVDPNFIGVVNMK